MPVAHRSNLSDSPRWRGRSRLARLGSRYVSHLAPRRCSHRGWSLAAAAALSAALASTLAPSLFAHELYLHPSTFYAEVGDRIALALEVGHAFAGSPVERRPGHLRRFVWLDAGGVAREVGGVDGAVPAGWLVDASAGLVTVSYESHAMRHELPADRFESYLREEGLAGALALRRERGEAEAAGRELFSRCAKTILEVGGREAPAAPVARVLPAMPVVGCPLELVPDAGVLDTAAAVGVRVLWQGRPLEGVLVRATRAGDQAPSHAVRSDEGGWVVLALGDGAWLVHAVHMTPLERAAAAAAGADWQSVWASLTFERRSE
jgi:uncharacterized GH25 family protein